MLAAALEVRGAGGDVLRRGRSRRRRCVPCVISHCAGVDLPAGHAWR